MGDNSFLSNSIPKLMCKTNRLCGSSLSTWSRRGLISDQLGPRGFLGLELCGTVLCFLSSCPHLILQLFRRKFQCLLDFPSAWG